MYILEKQSEMWKSPMLIIMTYWHGFALTCCMGGWTSGLTLWMHKLWLSLYTLY